VITLNALAKLRDWPQPRNATMTSESKSLLEHLPMHGLELERRKALVELSAADEARLAKVWPAVQPDLEALVAAYLRRQLETSDVAGLVADAATRERVRCEMTGYVESLFSGRYDSSYANSRLRIGFVHRRIGLPARHFLAALHHVHVDLRRAIAARVQDAGEARSAAEALERLLLFDESLIFDAYEHRLVAEARREHNRAMRYASSLEHEVAARTRELEQLSRTDALTGLKNRRAFAEELSREISRARRQRRPLAALYIDVDDFKRLNDCEGHARGDEALTAVAGAMTDMLRDVDVAARLGGDEFCVLLPDTDGPEAAGVAARLQERVRATCPVTVSVGTATLEDSDIAEPDALMRRADLEMYRNKHGGTRAGCESIQLAS
jgi:diguanylate cyclase